MWIAQLQQGNYTTVAAHYTYQIIAAATQDTIHLYDDDLNVIQSLKKDVPVQVMKWHPTRKFLAVGTVGIWCPDTDANVREGIAHQNVTCIEWSPNGNRLVSGDDEGGVVVWKVDLRGKLATMSKYRLRAPIQHILYKNTQKKNIRDSRKREESPPFYIADVNGTIFLADDLGHCTESLQSEKVNLMYYNESKDLLVILGNDMILSHYIQTNDGKLMLEPSWMQIKLGNAADSTGLFSEWIDKDNLAFIANGASPRVWDSSNEETMILEKPDTPKIGYKSFSFSKRNNILASSTDSGHVILWQKHTNANSTTWEPIHKIELIAAGTNIKWFMNESTVLVQTSDGFYKISDQISLASGYGNEMLAYQTAPQKLTIEKDNRTIVFDSPIKIKSFNTGPDAFLIWNGSTAEVFRYENDDFKSLTSMQSSQNMLGISEFYACAAQHDCLMYFNIKTGENSSMTLPSTDGDILSLCVAANKVILLTTEFNLKVFELLGRDSKLISTVNLANEFYDPLQMYSMKGNYSGSIVAIMCSNEATTIKTVNLDSRVTCNYDCGSVIQSFEWDTRETRFLVVNTKSTESGKEFSSQVMTFFVSPQEFILKEVQNAPSNTELLLSVHLPNLYFSKKQDFDSSKSSLFTKMTLKEYEGVDPTDEKVVKTITNFCFHLATGDIESVVKQVKLIKNEAVWVNLAHVCIKMKRIKLAKMCLGKLKNAKALRTISEYAKVNNDQNVAAQYAVHMGLYDEAKEMWEEMKSYADLNKFYQALGQWEQAIDIAATKDRASLPLTYYKFAQHLREQNDKTGAIAAYEKSNASKSEIPRMMLGNEKELKTYIENSTDKSTKKWWAQNAESHGDIETALRHYEQIGDVFSLVRVHCLSGNVKKARELADMHQDNLAAQFLIARHFESQKEWNDSISYYARSKCFGSAIRIAKEQNIDKELMQLAFQSTPAHMSEVARYFERKGNSDRAITLYSKSGNVQKALHLCFQTDNVKMIESIVASMDPDKDVESLHKASMYLSKKGSHESALYILVTAKKYDQIIDICEKQDTELGLDLVQKIQEATDVPKDIHLRLGEICLRQGLYQQACKSFTVGGDRLKAMGALLKSGDKDKIIMFANVSKHPEIFTVAANFLQTMNWASDTTVMRTIIQFYTKAKAFSSLSRFYETCAQIEIDEYQNYEKALAALVEAEKALEKDYSASTDSLKYKQKLISLFLEAYQYGEQNRVEDCEGICAELLNQSDIDEVIRIGDIFGLLIETNYRCGDREKATALLERLKMRLPRNMTVEYYVNDSICRALDPESYAENDIEEHIS